MVVVGECGETARPSSHTYVLGVPVGWRKRDDSLVRSFGCNPQNSKKTSKRGLYGAGAKTNQKIKVVVEVGGWHHRKQRQTVAVEGLGQWPVTRSASSPCEACLSSVLFGVGI